MRLFALLPLLAACGAETPVDADTAPAALPVAQAAAPGTYGMTLGASGAALPGSTLTFTATGAAPGERVYFALGFAEQIGALCPPVLNGGCIDIRNPQLLRTATANGSGVATVSTTVPGTVAPGGAAYFQALSPTATSNTIVRFNPEDTGVITRGIALQGQIAATPGASRGIYGYRFVGSSTGLDRCFGGIDIPDDPAAGVTPCPGCEFSFGTDTFVGGVEWFDNGSACVDLLGFDWASYFDSYGLPYGLALGVDVDYGTASLGISYPGYTYWVATYPATLDAAGRFDATIYSYPYGAY